MTDTHDTQALAEGGRLIDQMFTRLLRGDSLQDFGDWFASAAAAPGGPVDDPRAARAMARALWGAVPLPSNHWRARGLPKIERNDPCHCGSGRKYKHCCASFGHVGLPFDAQMLTALAIQHAPPEALGAASVRALPAHALAQAAMFWMEQDQPGQVVAVLGPMFEQPQGLDERHEPAFDTLMEALLALGQQTRRFALARQIAGHRDKALATAARARLVSMLADQGN
ncbi:MAG TPA: SEC-C domain-containing protein, partial [Ottowia sp.]|nr:SEC-C domain-containing protein [Ottowia sp.]